MPSDARKARGENKVQEDTRIGHRFCENLNIHKCYHCLNISICCKSIKMYSGMLLVSKYKGKKEGF